MNRYEHRIGVISDTHIEPGVDHKMLTFLLWFFSRNDIAKYITNGDFWDGLGEEGGEEKFNKIIESDYGRELFPLMKRRNVIDIEGDHNRTDWYGANTTIYSREHKTLHIERLRGNTSFRFMHGHQFEATQHSHDDGKRSLFKLKQLYHYYINLFTHSEHGIIFNRNVRRKVLSICNNDKNQSLVLGHSHVQLVDKKNHYYNSGASVGPNFEWLEIDVNTGKVENFSIDKDMLLDDIQ